MVSVGCVLLAAGESRRFGPEDKLLIGERPLLAQAMEKIASVGFARRLAVVSKREAADMAEQWGFEWVWNSGPARGIYSSIALGAENMTGPCMFSVADQPRMTEVILRDMAEAYENGTILQIRCQGQVGNPVIFPENLLRELAALGPGESGRTVIGRHRDLVRYFDVEDRGVLEDVDTKEDYVAMDYVAHVPPNVGS